MKESWIAFELVRASPSGKTLEWRVRPKGDTTGDLGIVKWWAPWRKYTFQPQNWTVFEQDCLRDIADFCEQQTREHKAQLAAKKTVSPV